jgi:hypothetical protein
MGYRSAIREEFYQNMLDDAATACHYWWDEHRAEKETPPLPDWNSLTINDVARGWRALLIRERAGRFFCCGSDRAVRDAERALNDKDGTEDYDACVADAVIQLALLGDLVYG